MTFVLHYGFNRLDCMDISFYPIYKVMEQLENGVHAEGVRDGVYIHLYKPE